MSQPRASAKRELTWVDFSGGRREEGSLPL